MLHGLTRKLSDLLYRNLRFSSDRRLRDFSQGEELFPELHTALFYLDGKLGDSVYLCDLYHTLSDAKNPPYVITTENLLDFWEEAGTKGKIITLKARSGRFSFPRLFANFRDLFKYRKKFDLVISLEVARSLESLILLLLLKPKFLLGYQKHGVAAFSHSIPKESYQTASIPMAIRIKLVKDLIKLPNAPRAFLNYTVSKKNIFCNFYAADTERTFSVRQVKIILDYFICSQCSSTQIIVNANLAQRQFIAMHYADQLSSKKIRLSENLKDVIASLKTSIVCVTPDTGCAHLASFMNIKTLVFYCDRDVNPIIWKSPFKNVFQVIPEHNVELALITDKSILDSMRRVTIERTDV